MHTTVLNKGQGLVYICIVYVELQQSLFSLSSYDIVSINEKKNANIVCWNYGMREGAQLQLVKCLVEVHNWATNKEGECC